jgi:hypothetical protein
MPRWRGHAVFGFFKKINKKNGLLCPAGGVPAAVKIVALRQV